MLAVLALMMLGFGSAYSTFSTDYSFAAGTGAKVDISSGFTQIFFTSDDDGTQTAAPYDIGFTFLLDGNSYTQFSMNSNGLIKLGGAPVVSGTRFNEDFPSFGPSANDMPFLAPFWDDLYSHGTGARYKLVGTAPNRTLVIEYNCEKYSFNNLEDLTMQVRLYETSNKVEFYYDVFTTQPGFNVFNGLIGIAMNTSNYVRVVPGSPAQFLTSGSGTVTPPAAGTLYSFTPCTANIFITGNVAQGGTSTMAAGDTLMKSKTVMRGNSTPFQPLSVNLPATSCVARNFTVTLGGAAAGDYQVSPASGPIAANGSQAISVTFTPTAVGPRNATLTVTDSAGFSVTYVLAANGQTRIAYSGTVAQGGTAAMNNGDVILTQFSQYYMTSQSYTPLTVTNINPNVSQPAAPVVYSLAGTSGGQYTVAPSSASIGANQSSTPVITFKPTLGGIIRDTLIVTADGNEVRRFPLAATGIAPKASYLLAGDLLDSSSILFNKDVPCVGVQAATYVVKVANPGFGDLHITGAEVYMADTGFSQGNGTYPLVRDAQGRAIPMADYVVTTSPAVMPIQKNHQVFPITIPAGDTTLLYFTYVGQRPTKRFARVYLRSDAVNFSSADTNGVMRLGLMRFYLVGRSVGSFLAETATNMRPRTITFPNTHVYDSSDMPMVITNTGQCDLRIARHSVAITAGDADEFAIVKLPSSRIDPVTNDVVIAPGASDTLMLRFKPLQMGSRRAGLRLETNDSTVVIPGVTERGVYYMDLFGNGKADLYATDVDFGMALIGGGDADKIHRNIRVRNTLNGVVVITNIFVEGADSNEFARETNPAWPNLPIILNGGGELDLGVIFAPKAGGTPGVRTMTVKMLTLTGDTIVSHLGGIAGTRTVDVTPKAMNLAVSVGKVVRRTIAITNTGTMPLVLQAPTLSPGTGFSIGTLPRLVVAPGQVEYLEVAYRPQASGAENAVVTIGSNASTGTVQVMLNGVAFKTRQVDVDPSQTVFGGSNDDAGRLGAADGLNVSGVAGEESLNGMRLWQSMPNPARELVEIRYELPKGMDVTLELFDAGGRLVRVLDAGARQAGEQRVMVDVRALASGVYHYRLSGAGGAIIRSMSVVR